MNIEEEIEHCKKVHDPTREALLHVIRGEDLKVGVEIGVQYGLNIESILENTKMEKIYGIDPYDSKYYPISPLKGMDEEIYQNAMKRLERFGDRYVHIRKPAREGLLDVKGEIDFIYIDGGKSKVNIIEDTSLWYPKIRAGGIMSGNDYRHPSHPWITRFLHKNYTHVNAGPGDLWWIYKNPSTNNGNISVVIPFYNASCYMEGILKSLEYPQINDVVIVDDYSSKEEYEKLLEITKDTKARVFRNEENLGEFKTRIIGAEEAKNEWVIFLDNDNDLLPEYMDAITNIPYWHRDVIYCPTYGSHSKIDYRQLSGCYLGPGNIKHYLQNYTYTVALMLGTGNYFMNRAAYLNTARPIQEIDKKTYGDFYFNGEWLKTKMMYMVKDMHYIHRIRKNSAWLENKHTIQPLAHQVSAELQGKEHCVCKHCERKRK